MSNGCCWQMRSSSHRHVYCICEVGSERVFAVPRHTSALVPLDQMIPLIRLFRVGRFGRMPPCRQQVWVTEQRSA